jgi:hypothetical protein
LVPTSFRTGAEDVPSEVESTGTSDGAFEAWLTLTKVGQFSLRIFVPTENSRVPIQGSPFQLLVIANSIVASSCTAHGTGVSSSAKLEHTTFFIQPRDIYGNGITADIAVFTVTVNGVQETARYDARGFYIASYTIPQIGNYDLFVDLTAACTAQSSVTTCLAVGRPVQGAPFSLQVSSLARCECECCSASLNGVHGAGC